MKTAQLGLCSALAALAAFVFLPAPVGAESEISIPFDDLIFSPPGSVVMLAEVDVEDDLVGRTCLLNVESQNQSSVHPGNDLIVSTGGSQAVVVGVEDEVNGGTNQVYEMVVGETINVELRIGQDGMSSLGFGLSFDCPTPVEAPPTDISQQVQAATTTTVVVTSTTVAPTTVPPTTAAPTTAPTTAAPTTAPPTTALAATSVSSVPATVAGAATESLPDAPPARAVTQAPAYTG